MLCISNGLFHRISLGFPPYVPQWERAQAKLEGFCRRELRALVHGDVGTLIVSLINLAGAGDFLFGIEQHLFPLSDPSARSRNREEHREHGDREAHGLIDQARIEINVGIELAADEGFVPESNTLDFARDI